MTGLAELASEARELRADGKDAVVVLSYMVGQWRISIHVDVPEALPHCTKLVDLEPSTWGLIETYGPDLDGVLADAMRRVETAVADTPSDIIAY